VSTISFKIESVLKLSSEKQITQLENKKPYANRILPSRSDFDFSFLINSCVIVSEIANAIIPTLVSVIVFVMSILFRF
jgi:hypothetical protein